MRIIVTMLCGVVLMPVWAQQSPPAPTVILLDKVVVSATREEQQKRTLDDATATASEADIRQTQPGHPAELLNRMPGVHVNNLGGEGHMTAIRQPITTQGVYLYLEDGIPTRPTGLFNHNALYETNIQQAGGVEVTKGPGSALHGSDSIGGVINVLTRAAPWQREGSLDIETGADGWQRILLDAGASLVEGRHAGRFSLSSTRSDTFRNDAGYERLNLNARLDSVLQDDLTAKTIINFSDVYQQGASSLGDLQYRLDPSRNLYLNDVGKREVQALRLSTELAWERDWNELVTVTPFFRHNRMVLMPPWMLSYDPSLWDDEFYSLGVLAKHRIRFENGPELIYGVDVDYTPMTSLEHQITLVKNGDDIVDYATGAVRYDYAADQLSVSPYAQVGWQWGERWHINTGLRYDYFHVDYENNLSTQATAPIRPVSQSLSYDHVSPKLGAIYSLTANQQLYANYRHSFRVPTVGQLFRSGSNVNSTELKPVKADSFELGYRGGSQRFGYELAVYHMTVKDDIVGYIDGGDRKTTNAGKTVHQGVELGLDMQLTSALSAHLSWTATDQEYRSYSYVYSCYPPTCIPPVNETRDYAGFKVGRAPEEFGSLSLRYSPAFLPGFSAEAEWEHLGNYYVDETNTDRYKGHDLLHLRAEFQSAAGWKVYGRVMNLADAAYSTNTTLNVGSTDVQYTPGLPRTWYLGLSVSF